MILVDAIRTARLTSPSRLPGASYNEGDTDSTKASLCELDSGTLVAGNEKCGGLTFKSASQDGG